MTIQELADAICIGLDDAHILDGLYEIAKALDRVATALNRRGGDRAADEQAPEGKCSRTSVKPARRQSATRNP
jgi:hypothetical protein